MKLSAVPRAGPWQQWLFRCTHKRCLHPCKGSPAHRKEGRPPGELPRPASRVHKGKPLKQESLQIPRLCSSPAPYLQCTHPKGEDVHSSPISLFCKTKPKAHHARGRSHHPLTLGIMCPKPCPYRLLPKHFTLSLPSQPHSACASARACFSYPWHAFSPRYPAQNFPIYSPRICPRMFMMGITPILHMAQRLLTPSFFPGPCNFTCF